MYTEVEQPDEVSNPNDIPTKFIGKSTDEIIAMYRETESELGKVRSQIVEAKKDKEAQTQQLQSFNMPSPLSHQPLQQPSQPIIRDPYSDFENDYPGSGGTPGTEPDAVIFTGIPSESGDGSATKTGQASLVTLGEGWVVDPL